jgi:uncharacterized damage-inducible protein DinB
MYSWKSYFVVQADYQHWADEVLFSALDHLQSEAIGSEQGLCFNSIHHTVDHMLGVGQNRKSTRLNSSHRYISRMPSSA